MTFINLKKLKRKICLRVCKWISLNAPKTKMPEWHSEVMREIENKVGSRGCKWIRLNAKGLKCLNDIPNFDLKTKLPQEAADGSDWKPQGLKCLNYIQKFYKIYDCHEGIFVLGAFNLIHLQPLEQILFSRFMKVLNVIQSF